MGPTLTDIPDGREFTALFVEAATAVPWTRPADLVVAPDRPLPALGGHFEGGCVITMADGRTLFASDQVSEATWRAVLSPRARDAVGPDWPHGPEGQQ